MGTIRVNPGSAISTGFTATGGTVLDILAGGAGILRETNNTPYAECPPGTPNITAASIGSKVFSASPPIDILIDGIATGINQLPTGFHIIAGVDVNCTFNFTNPAGAAIFGSTKCVTAFGVYYDSSLANNLLSFANDLNHTIPIGGACENPLTLYSASWEYRFTEAQNNKTDFGCGIQSYNGANLAINGFYLTGGYDIISTQWTLENLTHPNSNHPVIFFPGDRGKITDSSRTTDFTTITEIKTKDGLTIPSSDFNIWVTLEIEFTIPSNSPASSDDSDIIVIKGNGSGTSFSGYAMLGPIQISIANGSGIYKITSGKRNDTLYVNSSDGSQTFDNPIPDPFFKTGLIGG